MAHYDSLSLCAILNVVKHPFNFLFRPSNIFIQGTVCYTIFVSFLLLSDEEWSSFSVSSSEC